MPSDSAISLDLGVPSLPARSRALLKSLRLASVACVATIATLGIPGTAEAFDFDPDLEGLYLTFGLSSGMSFHESAKPGFVLGPRLALTSIREMNAGTKLFWWGGFVESQRDFSTESWRLSTGPYVGVEMLGVDLSYVVDFPDGGRAAHGLALRPMVTAAFVTVGLRGGMLSRDGGAEWFGDATLTFHLPILW